METNCKKCSCGVDVEDFGRTGGDLFFWNLNVFAPFSRLKRTEVVQEYLPPNLPSCGVEKLPRVNVAASLDRFSFVKSADGQENHQATFAKSLTTHGPYLHQK